jgi:4-hydroxy-tetrahydrodipicolinate synthase
MFQGMLTALITPFSGKTAANSPIDMKALDKLVEWQLSCGVDGLVLNGTTAESATMTAEERLAVVERVSDIVQGKVPIIVGTGTNCTRVSIEFTQAVKRFGVDGALVVAPYYNKPTQEGMFHHFSTVAAEGGLPVVVYNVPSRTSVSISVPLFSRLAEVDGIVAVKQAVDSAQQLVELADAVGDKIDIMAGDDALTYFVMAVGGTGVISASGNVIPREMKAIVSHAAAGDRAASFKAQCHALPIIQAMFKETNPAPAKAALKILGQLEEETMRLPLVEVTSGTREFVAQVLEQGGVRA